MCPELVFCALSLSMCPELVEGHSVRFDKLSEHNSVLPSQALRLGHHHEIAVVAASIAVIITSTGDQYQAR